LIAQAWSASPRHKGGVGGHRAGQQTLEEAQGLDDPPIGLGRSAVNERNNRGSST
jgi:hypothetical protein